VFSHTFYLHCQEISIGKFCLHFLSPTCLAHHLIISLQFIFSLYANIAFKNAYLFSLVIIKIHFDSAIQIIFGHVSENCMK
jgi:hypothetical protein